MIARSRIKTVRILKISFKGNGERRVRLNYIRAVPLWKTSYRLVLNEDGIPRLEGWALVQIVTKCSGDKIQTMETIWDDSSNEDEFPGLKYDRNYVLHR